MYFDLFYNRINGNAISIYLLAATSVVSFMFICKIIKMLPLISYIGKYSIVILCTHSIFLSAIDKISNVVSCESSPIVAFIITMVSCIICIPIFVVYFPYIVAQKDLIK